ncbi:MAG TPA: LLM class flavin-dependent oxidoreductase [Burkholderiales bacterium]|nr:LLM class flavin-dependent oxidoreductase [Burkholderiales bacterium]
MTLRLGVLDQSPVVSGRSPAEAVAETLALARLAEDLGYGRYWLAEHHAIAALADPCPEILLARVAAETSRMRVGTGGVLLPYYSPFKVAEIFRMLEALYPGRIDLGIGRAPGGDLRTAQAVAYGAGVSAEHFPQQVQDLAGFLDGTLPAGHPFAGLKAQPGGATAPQIWLLGSSDYSGALASQLGLRFAFAHFISARGAGAVMRDYREQYRPSAREPAPASLLCAFVICAATAAEAERLAASIDLRRLHMARGIDAPVPTLEEAAAHRYTEQERAYVQQQRARLVHGDPGAVREKLLALREETRADELMILSITGDYESRRESYRLVARAML